MLSSDFFAISNSLVNVFDEGQAKQIESAFADVEALYKMSTADFMGLFVKERADLGMMLA